MKLRLLVVMCGILFFVVACNKKTKKEEVTPAESTRVETPAESTNEVVEVDAGKVQAAFDMNREWARIETLAEKTDTVALEKLAAKYKFANALEMLNYIQFAILGGWSLMNKPEQKEEFEREYGVEAISVLMDEKNQKKIVDFVEAKRKASQGAPKQQGR